MPIKSEGNLIMQEITNIMTMTTIKYHLSQQDKGTNLRALMILISHTQIHYILIGENRQPGTDIIHTRIHHQNTFLQPNMTMIPIKHMMSFLIDILLENDEKISFNNID